jgi:TonB family protein
MGQHEMFGEMWKPLILSALVHGMIFGSLFVLSPYISSPRLSLPPAQMVQLVDLPSAGGPAGAPQSPATPQPPAKKPDPPTPPPKAEKPPEPKPPEPKAEKPPPPAKPKAPDPEMTAPVPKAPQPAKREPPKREEKKPEPAERPPIPRPPAEATRRPETPARQESERPGSRPGPGAGSGSELALGSGNGMLSLDTANFPYSYYLRQVTGRIEENWMRPQGNLGRVVVYFRIKRDGTIIEPQIHESSHNKSVDLLAAGAIKRSEPFPPLPIEFGGDYLGIYLCFGMGSVCPGQREG